MVVEGPGGTPELRVVATDDGSSFRVSGPVLAPNGNPLKTFGAALISTSNGVSIIAADRAVQPLSNGTFRLRHYSMDGQLTIVAGGVLNGPFSHPSTGAALEITSLETPALSRTAAGELFMLTVDRNKQLEAWSYPVGGAGDLSESWTASAARHPLGANGSPLFGPHPFQANNTHALLGGRPSLVFLPYLDANGNRLQVPSQREYAFVTASSGRGRMMFTRSEGRIEFSPHGAEFHRWGRPFVMDTFYRDVDSPPGPDNEWNVPGAAAFTNTERDESLPPGPHAHLVVRNRHNRLVHLRMGDGILSFGRNQTSACGNGQLCFEDYPDLQQMSTWLCRQVRRFGRERIRCVKDHETTECKKFVSEAPTGVCVNGGGNPGGLGVAPPSVREHQDPPRVGGP